MKHYLVDGDGVVNILNEEEVYQIAVDLHLHEDLILSVDKAIKILTTKYGYKITRHRKEKKS